MSLLVEGPSSIRHDGYCSLSKECASIRIQRQANRSNTDTHVPPPHTYTQTHKQINEKVQRKSTQLVYVYRLHNRHSTKKASQSTKYNPEPPPMKLKKRRTQCRELPLCPMKLTIAKLYVLRSIYALLIEYDVYLEVTLHNTICNLYMQVCLFSFYQRLTCITFKIHITIQSG